LSHWLIPELDNSGLPNKRRTIPLCCWCVYFPEQPISSVDWTTWPPRSPDLAMYGLTWKSSLAQFSCTRLLS
jgi:hypothetical protein